MTKKPATPPALANDEVQIGPVKGNPVTILALLVGAGLGIVVCYFFLANQPWWTTPLIANAVQATLAAWPTSTPWPTYTPAPAPSPVASTLLVPMAHIVKPAFFDGKVAYQTHALVTFANIPSDRYLWVVVHVPQVTPRQRVYPQLLNGIPAPVTGNGTLDIPVQFGQDRPQDSGAVFNVVALLLDQAGHQRFLQYARGCVDEPTLPEQCGGVDLPDAGVQILDFSTVIRQ